LLLAAVVVVIVVVVVMPLPATFVMGTKRVRVWA